MQGAPVRIAFVALQVPTPKEIDLHITIARRYDVIEADIRAMQHDLDRLIRPHLPFQVEFGNFCYLGEKGTFPAYKVTVSDPAIRTLLQRYHDQYYKEAPGKAMYPKLKFHVTVDTSEKRDFYENLMRQGERTMLICETLFRTTTKGAEPIIVDGKWTCPDCSTVNSMEQKECGSAHCDQWRPKIGDWNCMQCNYSNFATRTACAKCMRQRYDLQPVYALPPAPSAPQPQHLALPFNRKPDWICPLCKDTVFGSRPACRKCNTRNSSLI